MVCIEGGCKNCGRYTQISFESSNPPDNIQIVCSDCYKKYYSPEAIRDKKLNQVLKKSFIDRVKSLFKK